jgi:hypothetical protein
LISVQPVTQKQQQQQRSEAGIWFGKLREKENKTVDDFEELS